MKNKEKYDIRYMTFNVSQNQNGTIKSIDIYYDVRRIEKIKFLSETRATQAMNAIGNWLEEEYEPTILTDKEKAYLSAIIKPFGNKKIMIGKLRHLFGEEEYMWIDINGYHFTLPHFKKGKMYKGMELNKFYTSGELGL